MRGWLLKSVFWGILIGLSTSAAMAVERPRVVTTIFPLYDFIREVGGRRVAIRLILPPGIEPHAYEPSPSDIVAINDADVFFYTHPAMEPWVARFLPGVTNQNLLIVEAAQSAGLQAHEGDHVERGEAEHDHGDGDPHIWLNFEIDQRIVESIADALSTVDPDGKSVYWENALRYKERLIALDHQYAQGLKACRSRTIVFGGHFAFGYLASRYGLQHVSPYAGFSPDAEPGAKAVAELIQQVRENHAQSVFYEELLSPRLTEVIASESGAKPVLLHAAHNLSAQERLSGETFISIMEKNLQRLQEGLGCL